MKKRTSKFTAIELIGVAWSLALVLILILGGIGWCMNVYKITQLDFESPYKAEVLRGIGVIPPVGAIEGWMTFEEETK